MFLICHSRGHWKSLAWSHFMIIISSFLISKAKPGQNVSINSENEFMDKLEKKQKEWMKNALTSARKNWQSPHPKFNEIHSVPQLLYGLVTESLNEASEISKNLAEKVLIESLQNVINFMSGSSHIRSVLISIEYRNCYQTLEVYLLFAILHGQMKSKEKDRHVTYKPAYP